MILDKFLAPGSIALIGASPDRGKIRGALLHTLRRNGFPGKIYPVNPSYADIDGLRCYPAVAAIGAPIDLAIIAVPAPAVPKALEECGAAGAANALIISSGFAEEGGARAALQDEIHAIARRTGMRISGPNAEGFHNELAHVSATFSPVVEPRADTVTIAEARRIGVVAQSGGIGFALYDRGRALGLAFSTVISTGNEVDLGTADFFQHLVDDRETGVILLFLESIRHPQAFMAAAQEAAELGKPVIAVKIGATQAGFRAAASHTASMAGWDAAYHAVFERYGILTSSDPDEAIAMAGALATCPHAAGKCAAIVTVSGGAGAWAADILSGAGIALPELSAPLQQALAAEIPSYGSPRNPVDVTAQAVHSGALARCLAMLGQSDEIDLIVLVLSMTSTSRVALGTEGLAALRAETAKPVLLFSYTIPSDFARQAFAAAGAMVQTGLTALARQAKALATRPHPIRAMPPVAPHPPLPPGLGGAVAEYAAKRLLAEAGIAVPAEFLVRDEAELDQAAAQLGFPLALKIQSRAVPHKSEVGGVVLDVEDIHSARYERTHMLARAARLDPPPPIDGVLVQAMAPPGIEMIIGVVRDPAFGPIITIGAGGFDAELRRDIVHRLAPLDTGAALAMLRSLKIWPLLDGYRGRAVTDVAALVRLIVQLGEFAAAHHERVLEVELNPVIVHERGAGVTIVDALLTLGPA
jgi:acyl-CoA synthetase (NDP forming)